jgi:hypothetical protein
MSLNSSKNNKEIPESHSHNRNKNTVYNSDRWPQTMANQPSVSPPIKFKFPTDPVTILTSEHNPKLV